MDAVEKLDRLAAATVHCWAATYLRVWESACVHDGIDPASPCVVFSEGNPFAPYVERAFAQWQEARAGSRAVGYTGLEIKDGQAVIPENIVREANRLEREWTRQAKERARAALIIRLGAAAHRYVRELLTPLREAALWEAATDYQCEDTGKVAPLYEREEDGPTAPL